MLSLVAGGQLYTDTSLSLRYYRVIKTGYVNTLFLHLGGKILRQLSVVQHNGTDSGLSRLDIETGCQHLVAEVTYVVH